MAAASSVQSAADRYTQWLKANHYSERATIIKERAGVSRQICAWGQKFPIKQPQEGYAKLRDLMNNTPDEIPSVIPRMFFGFEPLSGKKSCFILAYITYR